MRVFEADQLRDDYIEGLTGAGYEYPNQKTRNALNYIRQFVERGSRELLRGYLPSEYADALVRLRDANSSRKLTDATKALCVDGNISKSTCFSELVYIDLPTDMHVEQTLRDEYYEVRNNEAKNMIRTAQDVIRTSRRESVELWLPSEVVETVPTFSVHLKPNNSKTS